MDGVPPHALPRLCLFAFQRLFLPRGSCAYSVYQRPLPPANLPPSPGGLLPRSARGRGQAVLRSPTNVAYVRYAYAGAAADVWRAALNAAACMPFAAGITAFTACHWHSRSDRHRLRHHVRAAALRYLPYDNATRNSSPISLYGALQRGTGVALPYYLPTRHFCRLVDRTSVAGPLDDTRRHGMTSGLSVTGLPPPAATPSYAS